MVVNSNGSTFIISSSASACNDVRVSRKELVDSTLKYRGEIIQHFRSLLGVAKDEAVTVSAEAEQLIEKVCEANRLLF